MASRGLASAQGRGPPRCAAPWFSWMNRASTSCLARSGPTRRGAHAGPPRVADARPPLGHGGCHAGGQDLHPDASGGAQRVAHHRVPQAPDPACRISTLGNLGRVAHPSPRRSRGVPCQRHGTWPSRRAVAAVCPGLESRRSAWQHLKHVEMRNLVCLDVEELHLELHLAVGRLRQKPRVIRSFFVGAGLEAENFSSFAQRSVTHGPLSLLGHTGVGGVWRMITRVPPGTWETLSFPSSKAAGDTAYQLPIDPRLRVRGRGDEQRTQRWYRQAKETKRGEMGGRESQHLIVPRKRGNQGPVKQ